MKTLPVSKAEAMLLWASDKNPGPWVDHSYCVAMAAKKIAVACGLEPDTAFALGLTHDIGRYKGVTAMQHILDGYELLAKDDYLHAAQICITHSFPLQIFEEYSGQNDCNEEAEQKVKNILENATYTEYDALIQLCDSLALPTGICLMEKRLVDVARRHGANELMMKKWEKLFDIFDHFQNKMEEPFYTLFPDIIKNTFGVPYGE